MTWQIYLCLYTVQSAKVFVRCLEMCTCLESIVFVYKNFPLLLKKNHLLLKLAEELLVAISFQLAMYLSTLHRHSLN